MYGELASIRGVVDLSSQDALDNAQAFLEQLGYTPVERTGTSLTVKRQSQEQETEQNALTLTVLVLPQLEGGVRMKVNGNDREGMQGQQAAWTEWSENLPKRPEIPSDEPDSYLGAAYFLAPLGLAPLAEKLHETLSRAPRALASASAPVPYLCTVRILARDATILYQALNTCRAVARAYLDLSPAAREVW